MKKVFFALCTFMCLASCSGIFDDFQSEPAPNGEIQDSYISISLKSADAGMRADVAAYQDGTSAERTVKSAYFFFFQNGEPFPVTVTDNAVSGPGSGENFLAAALTNTDPASGSYPNVADIKEVVLLLKNYKGHHPNQIVTIINWVPVTGKSYTMEELKKEVAIQSEKGFVMSNAVYADNTGRAIEATPLTISDIFSSEEEAKDSPIQIYVERIAAKVSVTTNTAAPFDINKSVSINGAATNVYAKITGWELYNEYQKSYLLKHINPTWKDSDFGFYWNSTLYCRSYWAMSPMTAWGTDNAFMWNGGKAAGLAANTAQGIYAENTFDYCGENTYREQEDRTKIILKAQLVKADGTTSVELAKWYGTYYIGEENLLTAVANTMVNTYLYQKNESYNSIESSDLKCYAENGKVYFTLSETGKEKSWYKYVNGSYDTMASADLNIDLKKVQPAVIYKNGQTYYYFDIKHLGDTGTDAEYGVVRNHIYNININSISGYGSPVYDPNSLIETPEYPDISLESSSFVSAQVNVLSWRMVSQGVDITTPVN